MGIGTSTLGDREGAHGVARATIYQYRGATERKLTVHVCGGGGVRGGGAKIVRPDVRPWRRRSLHALSHVTPVPVLVVALGTHSAALGGCLVDEGTYSADGGGWMRGHAMPP